MRFAMTARTLAHQRQEGRDVNDITARNIMKVTRYRTGGEVDLEKMAARFQRLGKEEAKRKEEVKEEENLSR